MPEKKFNVNTILFIFMRIGASFLTGFASLILTAIFFDDYMDRRYEPRDYLASTWNGFDTLFFIGIFLITLLFIWNIFKLKRRLMAAGFIAIVLICGGIFHAYQSNILEIPETAEFREEINLRKYEPFRENTLAKSLDEASLLRLKNNLPRLDGATALYPLYAAFVRATYPEDEYKVYDKPSSVLCSRTSNAFNHLLDGTADMIFLMGVSDEQREQAKEQGLELTLTPVGKEAFVFFVNKQNKMSDLSVENIKGIYSGSITNWREIGGSNREILAYQRPDASGSQVMLKEIMGDTAIVEAPEVNVYDEMMGMYMAVAYKNHKNAVGYSFLYYIRDMIAENKIKFLSIDGVEPTADNITSGVYPFAHDFYAVTAVRPNMTDDDKKRAENAKMLIEWILSSQGQSLVEKTGYVPLP